MDAKRNPSLRKPGRELAIRQALDQAAAQPEAK
jgi:hypothetical protein